MKVLWFILLKIVEVGVIVLGPYYLGKFTHLFTGFFCFHDRTPPECISMWAVGGGVIVVAALGAGIYLATQSSQSLGYCQPKIGGKLILGVFSILGPADKWKKNTYVYVVNDNNLVRLRYLVVMSSKSFFNESR